MSRVEEVPSPIDLRDMNDAREWERTALEKRPDRPLFFEAFVAQIRSKGDGLRVLELGSGPGFLAEYILRHCDVMEYVALDFSAAMHELANERLGALSQKVQFIEQSFKTDDWMEELGMFCCVVTNQAVHELRHKQLASQLHSQVRTVLSEEGLYLVNDHFAGPDGMANDELYMTREEQVEALRLAGFSHITTLKCQSKMAFLRAE
jgi:cyclopropane fatty-acyl-phospholipid synthase-like methyltransferase